MKNAGFTVIELIIAIALFTILLGLPSLFLWGIGREDVLDQQGRQMVSILNEAHTDSISNRSSDGQQPSSHGIYFSQNYYVYFFGTSYNANDSNNQRTDLSPGITLSTINVPNSMVVFSAVTGKVANFNASQNTIVLTDSNTQKTKTITISSIGGVTQ